MSAPRLRANHSRGVSVGVGVGVPLARLGVAPTRRRSDCLCVKDAAMRVLMACSHSARRFVVQRTVEYFSAKVLNYTLCLLAAGFNEGDFRYILLS